LVEKAIGTPSKTNSVPEILCDGRIQITPRKSPRGEHEDEAVKHEKTPMSLTGQQLLDTFLTPLKRIDVNAAAGKTPSSASKLHFSTPAFLRRSQLPTVNGNEDFASTQTARLPRKPLGRGLSAIVASLRKVEEEELDDDLEALREMERDGIDSKLGACPPTSAERETSNVAVDGKIGQLPPSAFNSESLHDTTGKQEQSQNGKSLKVYKKRGQKRTTRLVNMKPVRVKRLPNNTAPDDGDDSVPETHLDDRTAVPQTLGRDFGSDAVDPEGNTAFDRGNDDITKKASGKTEGPIKRVVRKVNAAAHANFRRLKLKNTGAKGAPGYRSKFRRRK
jgi:DNA replication regulator SLD2